MSNYNEPSSVTPVNQKQSPISEALDNNSNFSHELAALSVQLAEALAPVLLPTSCQDKMAEPSKEPVVPLAAELTHNTQFLREASCKFHDILDRLAL